ncbi:MAG: hypothetical protein Kow0099_39420 [Candidatus Abyssubacteria bacterium]
MRKLAWLFGVLWIVSHQMAIQSNEVLERERTAYSNIQRTTYSEPEPISQRLEIAELSDEWSISISLIDMSGFDFYPEEPTQLPMLANEANPVWYMR